MQRIILFDGVCNFCNSTVNTILVHDQLGLYHFAPIQSAIAAQLLEQHGLDPQSLNTVILIEGDQVFTKTTAIFKIAASLSGWPRLFYMLKFIPKPIPDFFYDNFAKYRYRLFGKRLSCMIPDIKHKARFLR